MFDYMWAVEQAIPHFENIFSKIEYVIPTVWSEHCVECSAPECYNSCVMYESREDGECVRIKNAIHPLDTGKGYSSSLGAILIFKKWAKIECLYEARFLEREETIRLYGRMNRMTNAFAKTARILPGRKRKWILTKAAYSFRMKTIRNVLEKRGKEAEKVYLACELKASEECTLIIEIKDNCRLLYRNSINVTKEFKTFQIELPVLTGNEFKYLCIYPEGQELEYEVTAKYIELLPFAAEKELSPDKKVKCVIWDLDNTLWDGVLIEDENIHLCEPIANLVKEFDKKGIINSICSKNDYNQAMKKLKSFGMDEYFVFSKINWQPKSVNISNTVKEMNIAADTFVFVDDSLFEREEVSQALPEITVVDVHDIINVSKSERFNVPVTKDSPKRRHTYQMLETQQKEMQNWTGSIDDFLKRCKMEMEIRRPKECELPRCYELIQRTNQLNASGRRLSEEDVRGYWLSDEYCTYVMICRDKYGSYGLVGFSIVRKGKIPLITDFVISCRVANKKVEHTFVQTIAESSETEKVQIVYKKTARNGPIFRVVEELDMQLFEKSSTIEIYTYCLKEKLDIIRVKI